MKFDSLITVVGWEERASLGFLKNLDKFTFGKVILVHFKEFLSTRSNASSIVPLAEKTLKTIKRECSERNIELQIIDMYDVNEVKIWKCLRKHFSNIYFTGQNVLLDITTIPRETIWSLLYFLRSSKAAISYIYYKPGDYREKWLSRDPGKPRLLFNHSGISELGKATCLLVLSGFDPERTSQLINFYEPATIWVGIQKGRQFSNETRNTKEEHSKACKGHIDCNFFELDAYDSAHGFEEIINKINGLVGKYNVIISSLGPKLSAISTYKTFEKYPEIALTYVPSNEFNPFYSHDIGDGIFGSY